jgi:hypothetical protein
MDVEDRIAADHADGVVLHDRLHLRIVGSRPDRGEAGVAIDDRVAGALAGGVVQDLDVVDIPPEIDDREQHEEEERGDNREFHERLTAAIPRDSASAYGARRHGATPRLEMRKKLSRPKSMVSGIGGIAKNVRNA